MTLYNSENSLGLDNNINNELWGTILQSAIDIVEKELNHNTESSNFEILKIDTKINTDNGRNQEYPISPLTGT